MTKIRSTSSKADALDEYLKYAGRTPKKKYWRWPRWKTLARISEGEDGSSSDIL